MSTDSLFMSTVFLPACLLLGNVYTLITSGVFERLSVYSPFKHQSSFSLILSSTTACHPHTKHKISFFFTVIAWFLIPHIPSSKDWNSGQIFGEGAPSWDRLAVKILGHLRHRFWRLGHETGRKRSSFKVVCVATIKRKKLKRLIFRSAVGEARPSSVVATQIAGIIFSLPSWGIDGMLKVGEIGIKICSLCMT